jgi:hypothetical protein
VFNFILKAVSSLFCCSENQGSRNFLFLKYCSNATSHSTLFAAPFTDENASAALKKVADQ